MNKTTDKLYCRLENTNKPYNKFYEIYFSNLSSSTTYVVYVIYGAIGKAGAEHKHAKVTGMFDAINACATLRDVKIAKGYHLVNQQLVPDTKTPPKKTPVKKLPKHPIYNRRLSLIVLCPPKDS